MKRLILFLSVLSGHLSAWSQQWPEQGSSKEMARNERIAIVNQNRADTNEVLALAELTFLQDPSDSGLKLGNRGIVLARKLIYLKGEADCLFFLGSRYSEMGFYNQAILFLLKALDIYENLGRYSEIAETQLALQGNYRGVGDYENSLIHAIAGEQLAESKGLISKYAFPGHRFAPLFLGELGKSYLDKGYFDSSLYFTQKAIDLNEQFHGTPF